MPSTLELGRARQPVGSGSRLDKFRSGLGLFIGILVAVTQSVGSVAAASLSAAIKLVVAAMLTAMALLTALTGARSDVVFFKVCPVVKVVAATLLIASA